MENREEFKTDVNKPPKRLILQIAAVLGSEKTLLWFTEKTEFLQSAVKNVEYIDEIPLGRALGDVFHLIGMKTGYATQSTTDRYTKQIAQVLLACEEDDFTPVLCSFITQIFNPLRFIDRERDFKELLEELNTLIHWVGIQVTDSGNIVSNAKPISHEEAKVLTQTLKSKLRGWVVHKAALKYCREDLLQISYHNAIFEAVKGISDRLRRMSNFTEDGQKLVNKMFGAEKNRPPLFVINSFEGDIEKQEHWAFQNLLTGIIGLLRNPFAHTVKKQLMMSEEEALESFVIVSYAHKMLDKVEARIEKKDSE